MNKLLFGYNWGKASIAIIPVRQEKADKSDWQDVDFSELDPECEAAYEAYKVAYKAAKAAREAYETLMRNAIGIDSHAEQRRAVAKPKRTLASYLAERTGNGLAS